MYNERRETFSFRSFFLTLLLLVVFILLMLFLFPTRWEFKKAYKSVNPKQTEIINDQIFTNNIMRMKDVARGYYTSDKLPKNLNQTEKMTLKEMYNKHLILKVKDKDGKECSSDKSYTEITNTQEGYKLKVNLTCGKVEDYIIVNLSDYSTCSSNTCVKVIENVPAKEEVKCETPVKKAETKTTTTKKTTTKTSTKASTTTQTTKKIAVTGISVSTSSVNLKVGETTKVNTVITPSNATNTNIMWSSNNANVATISNGTIKAVGAGTATITVTTLDGNKKATIKVTVTAPKQAQTQPTEQTTKPAETKPVQQQTQQQTTKPTQTVKYLYKKTITNTYYTDWSAWQTEPIKEVSGVNKVESKEFECGCKVQIVVPVPKEVKVGTRTVTKQVPKTIYEVRTGRSTFKPTNTDTKTYRNIKYSNGVYTWEELTAVTIYQPLTYTEDIYETRMIPEVREVDGGKVTKYREKVLKTETKTLTKTSTSKNDTSLINDGYKYVGIAS